MKRIFAQCLKELAQFRRDRLTVALAFILPIAILLIYGYAIRLESKNIPLSVQDLDHSPLSRTYVERLFATQQFIPTPLEDNSPTASIDRGVAKATVVIPPGFSRNIKSNIPVDVQVLVDGTDVNNARVIQNSLRATTNFFMQTENLVSRQARIDAEVRLWFNPGREEALYIVPGVYAVALWVFPSILASIAMVREKETGTIVQVYASDLTAFEWLLGKELAYLCVAIGEAVLIMGLGSLLFQMPFASEPTPLLVGTLVYLSASVAFGLFVGVRAGNQNAAVQGTAIAGFLTSFLLSGFIYRVENIPFPLSMISNILPARYYLILTRDAFVRGTGWLGVWYIPLIIAGIGILLFLGATRATARMQFKQ
ncbi:MAG: ABC transporter permease [Kamptonema sp. SIO4C4]|nr:ABC transporter permease [Kamptonema sp. SIO4C4]